MSAFMHPGLSIAFDKFPYLELQPHRTRELVPLALRDLPYLCVPLPPCVLALAFLFSLLLPIIFVSLRRYHVQLIISLRIFWAVGSCTETPSISKLDLDEAQ